MNDVGPSTAIFFHGGDIGLGAEDGRVALSASFRLFDGGLLLSCSLW